MIDFDWTPEGDSQLFDAVDVNGKRYTFGVRRFPLQKTSNPLNPTDFLYALISERGAHLSSVLTYSGICVAVTGRLNPPITSSERESNYGGW